MGVFGKIDIRSLWGVASVVVVGGILAIAVFSHPAQVSVWNDTGQDLRVTDCVDDTYNLGAGDSFTASGQTEHGKLMCHIYREAHDFCIAISHANHFKGTFPLSRANWVPGYC